jgi:sulfur relay protein TusB/DsrH
MLHLVYQSPLHVQLLARISAGDDVLFLSTACLDLLQNSLFSQHLSAYAAPINCYALADDMAERGLISAALNPAITLISYAEWVELSVKNATILSWN